MTRLKAAILITVNRAEYTHNTPERVLAWHAETRGWWSSRRFDESLFNGQVVFVRYAGTNEVIGRAKVINHVAEHDPLPDEPELEWRYEMEFLNSDPVRDVCLRDFGISGGRARAAVIGLSSAERGAINGALDDALKPRH